jgi:excisionase family DNA binding protein
MGVVPNEIHGSRTVERKVTPNMNTPMAMSPRDAARAIGISRSTLYRLIKQGRIRTVKLGRRTLVPTSALAELISEDLSDSK